VIPPSSSRFVANAHVVGGRFRLVRVLGEGGMGVVWEVIEDSTGKRRAAKFLRDEERSDMMVRRLRKEAQAVSAIRHPNVVGVVELAVDDDGTPVIVMELLDGETLGARLEREGCLSVGQTAAILRPVVSALRAAHESAVIHRDLKPDNIFLKVDESGAVDVRVLDFGIAKHANVPQDSLSITGTLLGTPLYMSPEQAAGERDLDARTDVWSIAIILYECLTGAPPVTGENFGQVLARLIRLDVHKLATVRPDLPADFIAVVDGALVPRAARTHDLAPLEAILSKYADAAIARPAAGSVPNLPPVSFNETIALAAPLPAVPQTSAFARGAAVTVATLVFAFLVGLGGYGWRAKQRAAATATPVPSAEPMMVASPVTEPAPVTVASEVPSTKTPPPPRPSVSSAPTASGPRKPQPKKLQGGVAGDVPF
jgi:eukaryotic-like serine/threonine-protein kinase